MDKSNIVVYYKYNETRKKYTARICRLDSKGFSTKTLYRYNRNEERLRQTVDKVIDKLEWDQE